jgi:hypothetical protein
MPQAHRPWFLFAVVGVCGCLWPVLVSSFSTHVAWPMNSSDTRYKHEQCGAQNHLGRHPTGRRLHGWYARDVVALICGRFPSQK